MQDMHACSYCSVIERLQDVTFQKLLLRKNIQFVRQKATIARVAIGTTAAEREPDAASSIVRLQFVRGSDDSYTMYIFVSLAQHVVAMHLISKEISLPFVFCPRLN